MTAADMDVGPAPPALPAKSHGAPAWRLARLLLHSVHLFRLAVLLLPMSACIIPVGPKFRDPSGAPNSPPFVRSTMPPEGDTLVAGLAQVFIVSASDNDAEDDLHFRWLIDSGHTDPNVPRTFPPQTVERSQNGGPLNVRETEVFECSQLSPAITVHKIAVVISDREFVIGDPDPTAVIGDTQTETVTWTWVASDCQQ